MNFIVGAGPPLTGRLRVPGDKSISHRALMLGAIADGTTRIQGFLDSEDTRATMHALKLMGVEIARAGAGVIHVRGRGLHGLKAPVQALDLANSGTSVRLFAGLLSGQVFDSKLQGDASLRQRPMRRIVTPLQQMGADIHCAKAGTLPLYIKGNKKLRGITYALPVASAQLKSAILLAGLYACGKTCIIEPSVTRDHSERMLLQFGCAIEKHGERICLTPQPLQAQHICVPADISSAAFFMVAALIVPGSNLLLEHVGINPTRHAVIQILRLMGADITLEEEHDLAAEPVANIRVRYSHLRGIAIPQHLVSIAIDEFPVLMIAAAYARGDTLLTGAAELRVKESDRIRGMCEGLGTLGVDVEEREDGMRVRGGTVRGGQIDSGSDHRVAMAFSVAALAASSVIIVLNCANVNTSFPGFVSCFQSLQLPIRVTGSGGE